jgi:hypothetical protein
MKKASGFAGREGGNPAGIRGFLQLCAAAKRARDKVRTIFRAALGEWRLCVMAA